MDGQYFLAIQDYDFLAMPFLLKIAAITFASLIVVLLENSTLKISSFSFLLMSLIYGILLVSIHIAFRQKFDTERIGNILSTAISILLCMIYAGMMVKRARDAGHTKTLAYYGCLPIINIFVIIYLFCAKSKINRRTTRTGNWTLK